MVHASCYKLRLCAHVNPASYPQWDRNLLKLSLRGAFTYDFYLLTDWLIVAYWLCGKGLVWLPGAVVCPHAAPWVQQFAGWAMDDRIMCCGIISSCQLAATSEIVKCFFYNESDSCKQYYGKSFLLLLLLLPLILCQSTCAATWSMHRKSLIYHILVPDIHRVPKKANSVFTHNWT